MQPAVEFIYATAFIVMIGAIIVFVFSYKKKLNDTAVCVYATVTHLWDPSSDLPSGLRKVDQPPDPDRVLLCERIIPTS
jgi:hypothetical protein